MLQLSLTPDDLLTTTRSVRKRLDLTRPVERAVLEECLAIAQQAPTATNRQHWQFIVVTDPAKRTALADLYRASFHHYYAPNPAALAAIPPEYLPAFARLADSATYLAAHMHEVPVLVVPCVAGRAETGTALGQASLWGSILPAAWSFMLAARARGLGTTWTTLHLQHEEAAAQILGIPYGEVIQAALIPVAYTRGTTFQPAARAPFETFVRWEGW